MRNSLLNRSVQVDHWEPKYPFDLVIAYEDLATRNRAMRLHDHLDRQLGDDFDFHCAWWKFEHLRELTLREQAVDDAISANMIVLSMHAESELFPAARAWIDDWSHRLDHHKCALVTLFAEPHPRKKSSPVFALLQQVARQARMDFFTNIGDATQAAELSLDAIAERARAVTPTLEEILEHKIPVRRWGLNEM